MITKEHKSLINNQKLVELEGVRESAYLRYVISVN